jgi:hypothetical protein
MDLIFGIDRLAPVKVIWNIIYLSSMLENIDKMAFFLYKNLKALFLSLNCPQFPKILLHSTH